GTNPAVSASKEIAEFLRPEEKPDRRLVDGPHPKVSAEVQERDLSLLLELLGRGGQILRVLELATQEFVRERGSQQRVCLTRCSGKIKDLRAVCGIGGKARPT